MASYKIYFLIFCHKNQPSSEVKGLNKLQNATVKAFFIEKAVLALLRASYSALSAVEQ